MICRSTIFRLHRLSPSQADMLALQPIVCSCRGFVYS